MYIKDNRKKVGCTPTNTWLHVNSVSSIGQLLPIGMEPLLPGLEKVLMVPASLCLFNCFAVWLWLACFPQPTCGHTPNSPWLFCNALLSTSAVPFAEALSLLNSDWWGRDCQLQFCMKITWSLGYLSLFWNRMLDRTRERRKGFCQFMVSWGLWNLINRDAWQCGSGCGVCEAGTGLLGLFMWFQRWNRESQKKGRVQPSRVSHIWYVSYFCIIVSSALLSWRLHRLQHGATNSGQALRTRSCEDISNSSQDAQEVIIKFPVLGPHHLNSDFNWSVI